MTLSLPFSVSTVLAVFSLSALAFFTLKKVRAHQHPSPTPNNAFTTLLIVLAFVITSILAGLILGIKDTLPTPQLTSTWHDGLWLTSTPTPQTANDQQPRTRHQEATRTGRSISFVGLIEPMNVAASSDNKQYHTHHVVLADVVAD